MTHGVSSPEETACTCPTEDCPRFGKQMREYVDALDPKGGPVGRYWECPECKTQRMWPDDCAVP